MGIIGSTYDNYSRLNANYFDKYKAKQQVPIMDWFLDSSIENLSEKKNMLTLKIYCCQAISSLSVY